MFSAAQEAVLLLVATVVQVSVAQVVVLLLVLVAQVVLMLVPVACSEREATELWLYCLLSLP
ncbi:MAG TPA: hypothetical protein VKF63_11295 [Terracidiphilus sp.]|nr:hypothetical protein [Terracidiphilus sp.]